MDTKVQQVFKCVLMGPQETGKTNLLKRMTDGAFTDSYTPTIGIDFLALKDKDRTLQLWDVSGQRRFLPMAPSYNREASLILVVLDPATIKSGVSQAALEAFLNGKPANAKILFAVNKTDLVLDSFDTDAAFQAACAQVIEEAKKIPGLEDYAEPIIFCSAKNNENVDEIKQAIDKHLDTLASAKNTTVDNSPVPPKDTAVDKNPPHPSAFVSTIANNPKIAGMLLFLGLYILSLAAGGLIGGLVGTWGDAASFFTEVFSPAWMGNLSLSGTGVIFGSAAAAALLTYIIIKVAVKSYVDFHKGSLSRVEDGIKSAFKAAGDEKSGHQHTSELNAGDPLKKDAKVSDVVNPEKGQRPPVAAPQPIGDTQ